MFLSREVLRLCVTQHEITGTEPSVQSTEFYFSLFLPHSFLATCPACHGFFCLVLERINLLSPGVVGADLQVHHGVSLNF